MLTGPVGEKTFSVVMPLFNKKRWVERAVRSVLAQDHGDLELIVVDDGSDDDGPEVVSGIRDARLRLVRQEHQGAARARNRGIEIARASRIAFLDADDEWRPTFLSTILDLAERFPDAGLYSTAYTYIDRRGAFEVQCGPENRDPEQPEIVRRFFRAALSRFPPVTTSAVCAPREALRSVGGFPVGVLGGEDQAVWARLALTHEVVISPRCEMVYHGIGDHNSSIFRYFGIEKHFDFGCLVEEFSGSPQLADLERWVAKMTYDTAMIALIHGDDQQSVNDLLRRVDRRHGLSRRLKIRSLQLMPSRLRRTLFRLYVRTTTNRRIGKWADEFGEEE